MSKENKPEYIPEFHKNLPLRAINQVVFRGDKGFEEATTVLLLQPDKTFTFELLIPANLPPASVQKQVELCIANTLPNQQPPEYVLLAIHSNGNPLNETDRKLNFRAYHFIFVKAGAFEFREKSPEDFRPRQLEIKVLENGLRFYADATYLLEAKEATIPEEIEAEFGKAEKSQ